MKRIPSKNLSTILACFFGIHLLGADAATRHTFSPDGMQPRAASQEALIAKDGEAQMEVVISPQASDRTRKTAAVVAETLGKITGAKFLVSEGSGERGIVIGTLSEFPDREIAGALKEYGGLEFVASQPVAADVDEEGFRKWQAVEAFAIRTAAGRIRLLGNTDIGAGHAAARFLELLGFRRYFVHPDWEVYPNKPTLVFDAEEESAPDFAVRNIWFAFGGFTGLEPKPEAGGLSWNDEWRFFNRHGSRNSAFVPYYTDVYGATGRAKLDLIRANPETFPALRNGIRNPENYGKHCISNPDVRKMIIDFAVSRFEREDGDSVLMTNVAPSDGDGWCECTDCAAMGPTTERAFLLANEAARETAERFPGRMVGTTAYFKHVDPPEADIEPNVFVALCPRLDNGRFPIEEIIELWPEKTKNLAMYDYFSTWAWGQDRLRNPGAYVPAGSPSTVIEHMRRFHELGYRFMLPESSSNFGIYGPGYFVATRGMWNVDADPGALMDDFLKNAFGPAAESMRKFYNLMDPASGRLMHRNTYAELGRLLDQASQEAAGHPEIEARLRQLKNYYITEYLQFMRTDGAQNTREEKEFAFRFLNHVYRSRHDLMSHYRAWAGNGSRSLAQTYNEPSWQSSPLRDDAPWQNGEAYSEEELQALFREALAYFQPVALDPMAEEPAQVVRGNFPSNATAFRYGSPLVGGTLRPTLHFLSEDGEPLRMRVVFPPPSPDPHGHRGAPEVRVWIRDRDGNLVHKHSATLSDKKNWWDLKVPLPGPGEYSITASQRGTEFEFPEGGTWFVRDAGQLRGKTPLFFVAPEGVSEIQGFLEKGAKASFHSPTGETITVEGDTTRIFRVPAPREQQGSIWSLSQPADIRFLNIPNLLSPDPARVVVPKL